MSASWHPPALLVSIPDNYVDMRFPYEILLEIANALAPDALARLCRASKLAYGLLHPLLYRSVRIYSREQVQRLRYTFTAPRGPHYALLVRRLFLGFNACVFLAKCPTVSLVCPALVALDVELDAFFCRTTFAALSLSTVARLTVSRAGIHPSWIIKIISQQPSLRDTLRSLHVDDMHFVFMTGEQSFSASDIASLHALRTVSLAYDLSVHRQTTTSATPSDVLITRFLPALEAFLTLAQLTCLRVCFHSTLSQPPAELAPFIDAIRSKRDARVVISTVPRSDVQRMIEQRPMVSP